MYICKDCGKLIYRLKHFTENHDFSLPPYEEWDGCPNCGGWACVEAISCCKCSKYIMNDYIITVDNEIICSNCYNEFNIDDL